MGIQCVEGRGLASRIAFRWPFFPPAPSIGPLLVEGRTPRRRPAAGGRQRSGAHGAVGVRPLAEPKPSGPSGGGAGLLRAGGAIFQTRSFRAGVDMSEVDVVRASEQPFKAVEGDGARGLELARLYRDPENGATFQLARVAPGGVSKRHAHEWVQANWIAGGQAEVDVEGEKFILGSGDSIVIPGGKAHHFRNPGQVPLVLVAVLGPGAP